MLINGIIVYDDSGFLNSFADKQYVGDIISVALTEVDQQLTELKEEVNSKWDWAEF